MVVSATLHLLYNWCTYIKKNLVVTVINHNIQLYLIVFVIKCLISYYFELNCLIIQSVHIIWCSMLFNILEFHPF